MMFKVATVSLEWNPNDFWQSTPRELWAAIEGSEEAAARMEELRNSRNQG